MESILSRWRTYFDFFWPHLEILHSPPTGAHWLKALQALERTKNAKLPSRFPCLIIAAARHGMGRLENRPCLCEIALNTIIDPLSNDDWFWLSMKDDNHLNRYIQYHLETVEKKLEKWRPLGYQTPTMRREHDGNMGPKTDDQNQISVELDLPPLPLFTYIVQRASNGNLSFRALVEYEDLESAANYLKALHKQHTDSPSVLRQYNRKASGIRISSIPFDCIDEADRKCYICYQDLSDYEVVSKRRGEAAREEVEYARVKHTSKTFLMPAGTKGTWVRELINYERSESNSDRWDTMITKDLSSFVYGFISAWYRWENIPHEHGCRGPVKLSCGHFFGFDCISEWLNQSWTCPLCRRDLREGKDFFDSDHPVSSEFGWAG